MLSAIILAGGRSSRMGTPKALLPFDEEPLIVHLVRRLQPLFDDIVVVAAPGQPFPSMPVSLIRDEVAYQGPVGGIYYGLQAAAGEFAFVTSCDSAFLSTALIAHLLSQRAGYDIVVPRWEGRFQPLVAVYRKTVVSHVEGQLARGELRPVYLFDKVRTRCVEEAEVRRVDPAGASFFNMNRPEDYEEALRRWSEQYPPAADTAITCTVELFGVARLLAHAREITLDLPPDATLAQVLNGLAERVPVLVGRVISPAGAGLMDGYACNVNGLDFVRGVTARVNPGDNIAIVSADAGG